MVDPTLAAPAPAFPSHSQARRRIVLTTFGSLGDVHPYIAIAQGLQARGHQVTIATSPLYREKIEALQIGFAPVRPELPEPAEDPEMLKRAMDLRKGSEFVVRELVMPHLRDSFDDVFAAAAGADLLVSHPLTFVTPLAAEKLGIPWASSVLAPLSFFSACDPPVLPPMQWMKHLRPLGPWFWRALFGLARRSIRSWSVPYHRLRTELGLPATALDPLLEGQHSPHLVLALYSPLLGAQQPDWPKATVITGFPFYDRHEEHTALAPELARFLDEGEPPIVFTLGSSAVMDAGPFYSYAAQAAASLRRRAVLLIGKDDRNRLTSLPEGVIACEYAPYSELLPRAAAIVHQGGVGTTAQALRSGRPMLVMPYAHDQPDNADRVVRLGVARTIPRQRISPARLERELRLLLDNCDYARRAAEVGVQIRAEDGVGHACDALLELCRSTARSTLS